MRKQMIEDAAYEVATQIRTVEDGIDAVLAETAELQARVMRVNSVACVGPGTIHQSLEQLAIAISRLVETRGSIVACHVALAEAKGKVPGLRTTSWGDAEDCPPPGGMVDLRVVA